MSDEAKAKCMEDHNKLREELSKRDAQMDNLRNMIATQLQKKEKDTKNLFTPSGHFFLNDYYF